MISVKTALRWACAAIASLVTGFYGAHTYAWADTGCSLKDVQAYHSALNSVVIEVTPAYKLRLSKQFIAACPKRFEVRDAYLIAARGALDSGKAEESAKYYDAALNTGLELTPAQRLDYAAALMSTGDIATATAMRDTAILNWAIALTGDETARLKSFDAPGGVIYAAKFEAVDPALKISALWIAAPDKGGFPATAIIRPDETRAAWRKLRTGHGTDTLQVAELYRCREKELLDDSETALPYDTIAKQATARLKAYLKNPDQLEDTRKGRPIAACYFGNFMFHRPNPYTAVSLDSLNTAAN